MVDVKNLSELLSQCPDVVDVVGARSIPILSYRYLTYAYAHAYAFHSYAYAHAYAFHFLLS